MRRGPKPKPRTATPKLREGGLPRCPAHLDAVARREWRRLARPLFEAGILDRGRPGRLRRLLPVLRALGRGGGKLQRDPEAHPGALGLRAAIALVSRSPTSSSSSWAATCPSSASPRRARSRLPDLEGRQTVQPPIGDQAGASDLRWRQRGGRGCGRRDRDRSDGSEDRDYTSRPCRATYRPAQPTSGRCVHGQRH